MENKTKRFTYDVFNRKVSQGEVVVYKHEKYTLEDFYYYTVPLKSAEDTYLILKSVANPNKIVEFVKPNEILKVLDREVYLSE
mgnify:CR=1 FL=1|jgi:hypothetical protein